jgi:mannose-6-phosphate isomerase-like protein (cupin superfamily)
MLRNLVLSAVLVGVGSLALQRQIDGQTEPVTYYDFTKTAGESYGPYPMTWMVVSASNSLALAVVPDGFHQTAHHHDQEQFTLGVEGPLDYSIGGIVHHIGPNGAGIPPANVQHGMTNDSDRPVMMLEFQPVRREDWLPPHPQVRQPQSAEPVPLDRAEQVTVDYGLSSDGWRRDPTGARVKSLAGRTIRANFWDLSAAHSMVDVTAQSSANERFVFVLSGRLASQVGSSRREVGARTAIVVTPSARGVQLQSLAAVGTAVVVFERIDQ